LAPALKYAWYKNLKQKFKTKTNETLNHQLKQLITQWIEEIIFLQPDSHYQPGSAIPFLCGYIV
jgi:hypothetical protein